MVRTQIFDVTYGGCNCVLFEPNIDELEGRCLLAPETFTSVDDNNGIVLKLRMRAGVFGGRSSAGLGM